MNKKVKTIRKGYLKKSYISKEIQERFTYVKGTTKQSK